MSANNHDACEHGCCGQRAHQHAHGHSHDHGHSHGAEGNDRAERIRIGAGGVVFALGLVAEQVLDGGREVELALFLVSYAILGGEVVSSAFRNLRTGRMFDENFLMSVATIGAFAIGNFPEAVAVMLFYRVGEYFQNAAVRQSKKSIAALMDIRPDVATIERAGEFIKLAPEAVTVGEVLLVKPGEKIPLDGVVLEGESALDTRALSGESLPRTVVAGDVVLSGCINQSGVLRVTVTKLARESTVSKIIELVEHAADKKSPSENFITAFARFYTPVVVALAALLAVIAPLFLGGAWAEWIHRGLVFLVISCPCALVISIPLSFFAGIGSASRRGILVKGSNFLEALNHVDQVVFDKTGTLTRGVFEVTRIEAQDGFSTATVLEYAACAARFSSHPVSLSIARAYAATADAHTIDQGTIGDYREISGQGASATVSGKTVLSGNARLLQNAGISVTEAEEIGTKVYLAVDGKFAGVIVIADTLREDSRRTIEGLKARGVRKTVMLTGDNEATGAFVARQAGVDEFYAQLLPAQKVEKMEHFAAQGAGKIAFVGDGINDAPPLARADIGIAMGGLGSDAAIKAADVVLMTDQPSRLLDAIDIARATRRIVWQNIGFALGVKGVFLVLAAFGITTMWEAVFADVGVSVLAILNAVRGLRPPRTA
ncbi:cadmium transporter [Betaproteobacteria bacterium]|nr:cadmium transporter [Betaproteobacteria bacterium]GHU00544.1 cadmium transporter [Betaproteobacteria bacterium]GHU20564.1 cadmium transporter [Betaproteobacteria bacterium]